MAILVCDVMTRDVQCAAPTTPLVELERLLIGAKLGGVPVVDRGKLVGVASRSDVVRRLLAGQEYREYAETEHGYDAFGFDVPLQELWPTSERGLRQSIETELNALLVRDIMSEHPLTVSTDSSVETAGKLLLEKHVHRLIVVEGERVVGLLSALDIVRCYCGPT